MLDKNENNHSTKQQAQEGLKEENKRLQEENKKCQDRISTLIKKNEEIYKRYNTTLLIIITGYSIITAFLLFFTEKGIAIFATSTSRPILARVLLYILFTLIVIPSFSATVALYYRSYQFAEKDRKQMQEGTYDITKDNGQSNVKKETWGQWFKRQYKYYTNPEVQRRYVICWALHAVSIAAYIGIFCFVVKGIYYIVNTYFPKPEWHNVIIYSFITVTFVLSAVCDGIFYYAVSQMIWWNQIPNQEKNNDMVTETGIIPNGEAGKGADPSPDDNGKKKPLSIVTATSIDANDKSASTVL